MTETVVFVGHLQKRPRDKQLVWFLQKGNDIPVPAEYSAQLGDGKPGYLRGERYDLLGGRIHYPIPGDSWAPLIPPAGL